MANDPKYHSIYSVERIGQQPFYTLDFKILQRFEPNVPRIINLLSYIDVHNSCKLVKISANLGQMSWPLFHQDTVKGLAAIKKQESGRVASFSLKVKSERH